MKSRLSTTIPFPRLPKDPGTIDAAALGEASEFAGIHIFDKDLARVTRSGVTMEQVLLHRILFNGSRLNGARLFDVQCEGSDLSGASWQRSRWQRVYVKGCKLTGMQLPSFNGIDVIFHECAMEGMIFSGGKIKGLHCEKCRMGKAVFDRLEIGQATFRGCDLTGVDLSGCQLHGVDLRGSDIPDIRIEVGQYKGLIIDPVQAAEFMARLGCTVAFADEE